MEDLKGGCYHPIQKNTPRNNMNSPLAGVEMRRKKNCERKDWFLNTKTTNSTKREVIKAQNTCT